MSACNIEHRGSPQLRHSYTIIHADREFARVLGAILFAMFIHRSDRRDKRDNVSRISALEKQILPKGVLSRSMKSRVNRPQDGGY